MSFLLDADHAVVGGVVRGARDMLREAAKQFRQRGDQGHAAMCENHAAELDRLDSVMGPGPEIAR